MTWWEENDHFLLLHTDQLSACKWIIQNKSVVCSSALQLGGCCLCRNEESFQLVVIGTWGSVMKMPWRPFWTPAVHVHNLQLSSAGSFLCSRCNLWLSSSAWMHPRRSDVWSVIRYGWFNVEMEGPAAATCWTSWADISAVFEGKKNHIMIGLRD